MSIPSVDSILNPNIVITKRDSEALSTSDEPSLNLMNNQKKMKKDDKSKQRRLEREAELRSILDPKYTMLSEEWKLAKAEYYMAQLSREQIEGKLGTQYDAMARRILGLPPSETKIETPETNSKSSKFSQNELNKKKNKAIRHQMRLAQLKDSDNADGIDTESAGGHVDYDTLNNTEYYYLNGYRMVWPYSYAYRARAKARWCGRTLRDIIKDEFAAFSAEYFDVAQKLGRILVDGKVVDGDHIMESNSLFTHLVHRHEPSVRDDPIDIVYHDANRGIIVINKPSTIPVHPSGKFRQNSIVYILARENNMHNVHLVHRLDRATSGLMVLALHSQSAAEIGEQMQKHTLQKHYLARVKGRFPFSMEEALQMNIPVDETPESRQSRGQVMSESFHSRSHSDEDDEINEVEVEVENQSQRQKEIVMMTSVTNNTVDNIDNTDRSSESSFESQFIKSVPHKQIRPATCLWDGVSAMNIHPDDLLCTSPGPIFNLAMLKSIEKARLSKSNKNTVSGEAEIVKETEISESSVSESSPESLIPFPTFKQYPWGENRIEICVDRPVAVQCKKYSIYTAGPRFVDSPSSKESQTIFRAISYDEKTDTTLVHCMPKTGRTHQIRVHLQHIGFPIANDERYGGTELPQWCKVRGVEQIKRANFETNDENSIFMNEYLEKGSPLCNPTNQNTEEYQKLQERREVLWKEANDPFCIFCRDVNSGIWKDRFHFIRDSTTATTTTMTSPLSESSQVSQASETSQDSEMSEKQFEDNIEVIGTNDYSAIIEAHKDYLNSITDTSQTVGMDVPKKDIAPRNIDNTININVYPDVADIDPDRESIWLHAYKYEGPEWTFQVPLPEWAGLGENGTPGESIYFPSFIDKNRIDAILKENQGEFGRGRKIQQMKNYIVTRQEK